MPKKSFRQILEARCGLEECEFSIPHLFLPPRFKKISKDRNMILLLDLDMVAHVRWEGQLMVEHHPLTPGAIRRLMKDVFRNLARYKRDLEVANRFITRSAEEPFWDPRETLLTTNTEGTRAELPKDQGEEIVAVLVGGQIVEGTVEELTDVDREEFSEIFGW